MSHKHKPHREGRQAVQPDQEEAPRRQPQEGQAARAGRSLSIVLKCDASGSLEAVAAAIRAAAPAGDGVGVEIIRAGVGDINKSDIFLAATASRLIVGFNVGTNPQISHVAAEQGVEIRIYSIIYKLTEDIRSILASLAPTSEGDNEEVIGTARVIALFKSSRRGIILGCEVREGQLAVGRRFRVITAMGPVYAGRIESLHIEKDAVSAAGKGQQVGLKIVDFQKVHVGDLVESFRPAEGRRAKSWSPQAGVSYR